MRSINRSTKRYTGRGMVYRGVPTEKPAVVPLIQPLEGEPSCSHCGCAVRAVKYFPGEPKPAPKPLAGNHRYGGTKSKQGGTCPGSYKEAVYI